MTSYQIVKTLSQFNILLDTNTNERVYTVSSWLYKSLQDNYDLTEKVLSIIKRDQMSSTLKTLTRTGRICNNELRKSAFAFFQIIGWNQPAFFAGYARVLNMFPKQDALFVECLSKIEEGFFTITTDYDFYIFIREFVEGSIVGKRLMINLLNAFIP
jgi:hypothetical protein